MTEPVEAQIETPVDDAGVPVDLPNITKTDAKTLTSLVRNDYKMLNGELGRRKSKLEEEIRDQRHIRQQEDEAEAKREMAGLGRRLNSLNKAIVEKLTELADAGWTHRGGYRETVLNPHSFALSFPVDQFVPPERSNEDLRELDQQLSSDFFEATGSLSRQEADIIRTLALQSVTSDGAREMILSLPTPESLLSRPQLPA